MKVTILEAKQEVGGRVRSSQREGFSVPVDLGASIITGTEVDAAKGLRPDPSAVIARCRDSLQVWHVLIVSLRTERHQLLGGIPNRSLVFARCGQCASGIFGGHVFTCLHACMFMRVPCLLCIVLLLSQQHEVPHVCIMCLQSHSSSIQALLFAKLWIARQVSLLQCAKSDTLL